MSAKRAKAAEQPKGLTRDFFTAPIRVAMTFQEPGGASFPVVITMRRETVAMQNAQAVSGSLFNTSDNYERFCALLEREPEGIADFPRDSRPLKERAREYFAHPAYTDLITFVVMEVERAQKPVEFFQRF